MPKEYKLSANLTINYIEYLKFLNLQCSKAEMLEELASLDAFKLDSKWYLMSFDYKMKILSHIINFFDENSWSLQDIQRSETIEALEEIEPAEVIAAVFNQFTVTNEDGKIMVTNIFVRTFILYDKVLK